MATPSTAIEPFSIGHSVGFGKSLASQLILMCVAQNGISDSAIADLMPALVSLCRVQATYDPAGDIETQVLRSLTTKMHMTNRQRPDAVQLCAAFSKSVQSKQAVGDTRVRREILAAVIDTYNLRAFSRGCRIHNEERAAINLLDLQTPGFIDRLKRHWQAYQVSDSAVPVTLLNSTFLRLTYVPPVTAKENPLWHRILSPSAEKNEEWLNRSTTAFTVRLDVKRASGKVPTLRGGAAAQYRDSDPSQVHQLACLWVSIMPDLQKSVSAPTLQKLHAMFRRGALDRELL